MTDKTDAAFKKLEALLEQHSDVAGSQLRDALIGPIIDHIFECFEKTPPSALEMQVVAYSLLRVIFKSCAEVASSKAHFDYLVRVNNAPLDAKLHNAYREFRNTLPD